MHTFVRFVDGEFSKTMFPQSQVQRCSALSPMISSWTEQKKFTSTTSPMLSTTIPATPLTDNSVQKGGTLEATVTNDTSIRICTVPITFIESDGKERLVQAEIGKHLLDVAHDNHVDLEGACGGELSCSTCHLIFESNIYNKLPPKLDDEQDMLDLAFGVTETYV
jgi:ferredoxin-2, mitochondrial